MERLQTPTDSPLVVPDTALDDGQQSWRQILTDERR